MRKAFYLDGAPRKLAWSDYSHGMRLKYIEPLERIEKKEQLKFFFLNSEPVN